ncbi:uncharacterized protein AMSG_04884, partial [Thecamonas trahens ATCC 50062]
MGYMVMQPPRVVAVHAAVPSGAAHPPTHTHAPAHTFQPAPTHAPAPAEGLSPAPTPSPGSSSMHGSGGGGSSRPKAGMANMEARIEAVLDEWEPVLDREVMELAVAHAGNPAAMLALLDKAASGKPIKIQLLGSSVVGAYAGRSPLDDADLAQYGGAVSGKDAADGYFTQAFEASLGAVFPHAEHKIINSGIGGSALNVYARCTSIVLPHMDMYVLESTIINRIEHEKHLERVLLHMQTQSPGAPVVLWNMFRWCVLGRNVIEGFDAYCSDKPFNYDNLLPLYTAETVRTRKRTYVPNDRFADIAEYYGLAVLSVRNSFFHAVAQQTEGFGWHDMLKPDDIGVHPTRSEERQCFATCGSFSLSMQWSSTIVARGGKRTGSPTHRQPLHGLHRHSLSLMRRCGQHCRHAFAGIADWWARIPSTRRQRSSSRPALRPWMRPQTTSSGLPERSLATT